MLKIRILQKKRTIVHEKCSTSAQQTTDHVEENEKSRFSIFFDSGQHTKDQAHQHHHKTETHVNTHRRMNCGITQAHEQLIQTQRQYSWTWSKQKIGA